MSKTVVLARPYPFIATEMRPLLEGLGYQKKPDLLADLDNMVGGAAGAVVSLALSSPIPLQTCPMCGPTLVVKRDRQPGQHIYCRNCSGEFKLMPAQKGLHAQPTGGMGPPWDLEPELDVQLIERTVAQAVEHLSAADLLATAALGHVPEGPR